VDRLERGRGAVDRNPRHKGRSALVLEQAGERRLHRGCRGRGGGKIGAEPFRWSALLADIGRDRQCRLGQRLAAAAAAWRSGIVDDHYYTGARAGESDAGKRRLLAPRRIGKHDLGCRAQPLERGPFDRCGEIERSAALARVDEIEHCTPATGDVTCWRLYLRDLGAEERKLPSGKRADQALARLNHRHPLKGRPVAHVSNPSSRITRIASKAARQAISISSSPCTVDTYILLAG